MKVYNIMKYRYFFFALSGIVLALGIFFYIYNHGINYGIDFTGGMSIQADIGTGFSIDDVRTLMANYDKEAVVTYAGNENESALIRTKITMDEQTQTKFISEFTEKFNITSDNMNIEVIGPTIGNELKRQAVWSLILANLGILIYVSFRFEWKFGVASVLALLHDVLIMLTVYVALQIPANSSFIAAILTIVGYSINDTIVIFDKIRETLKNSKRGSDDIEIVNKSVTSTMARSINTSLTTLVTIAALYILGVPAVKDFALPLIVGIISGAYSSIFIASPIWVMLRKRLKPVSVR